MKKTLLIATALLSTLAGVANATENNEIKVENVKPIKTAPILARACEEGMTVYLNVTIREDGSVSKAKPIDTNWCNQMLAQRVVNSVEKWTFEPARNQQNQPVSTTVRLPVKIVNIS